MAQITPQNNRTPQPTEPVTGRKRKQVNSTLPPEPTAVVLEGDAINGAAPAEAASTGLDAAKALELAKDAYESATDYVDDNFRKKWETNLRYFDNRHAADSKYYKDAYKHRHKHFRPKSRSIARRMEALVANAFFSHEKLLNVEPINPNDPMSAATGEMVGALMEYRLRKTIPWFLTLVGAMQDAVKTGVCVSYNHWCYRTKPGTKTVQVPYIDEATGQPALDPMTGMPMMFDQEVPATVVAEDQPKIELFPVEYLRISPNARWDRPIETSPYVGRMVPMTVLDVKRRMENADQSGRTWKKLDDAEIKAKGTLPDTDSTRQARLGTRQDPTEDHTEVSGYEIVWPIEWFIDHGDEKYVFWTLGTDCLLSEPEEISDVYLHGRVPITMGYCVLETHKVMPDGLIGIGASTQRIINDSANMRYDNVALVLSKQWAIRAGQQVDTSNLMYGVPGGVTAFQNPQTDVVPLEWNDVTSSAYQEQDRHNVDYDELVGNFSASSVMTGKNMSETVGGMEILGSGAATLSEYTVRLFTETWVIPTLNQLAMLEQYYETDEKVFAVAGPAAEQAYRLKHGEAAEQGAESPPIDEMIENLINEDCMVNISVGMNATDPNRQLQRFLFACNQVAQFSQNMPTAANTAEMAKEVFRILGFGDGARFWDANEDAKNLLRRAQETAQQMLKEADNASRALMEEAQKRRQNAEQAEEAAMEEQQQLTRERQALTERTIAAAMKELKVEKREEDLTQERRILQLEKQLAEAQVALKAAQAAKAAKGPQTPA
jgi:hypothetical protein